METRVCPTCDKEFRVGGRGNPPKDQVWCSRHCRMLQQTSRKRGSHAKRPKKGVDTIHKKEWLYDAYVVKHLSTTDIGEMLGISRQTVKWHLRNHGIPGRSQQQARKILFDRRGRKNATQSELIDAYGGRCACCGEREPAFLTLDHIGGGGNRHRRLSGGDRKMKQEIKRLGFPKDKYRLLCMNCQIATRFGRTCPHQLKGN